MSIHAFYKSTVCRACQLTDAVSGKDLCSDCLGSAVASTFVLEHRQALKEAELHSLA